MQKRSTCSWHDVFGSSTEVCKRRVSDTGRGMGPNSVNWQQVPSWYACRFVNNICNRVWELNTSGGREEFVSSNGLTGIESKLDPALICKRTAHSARHLFDWKTEHNL